MSTRTFQLRSEIECPVEELFAWHERPGAFDRLNPPWEPVQVIERFGGIRDGARVTLRVPLGPLSVKWMLEHQNYIQHRQFQDVQRAGLFRSYCHTHHFESLSTTQSALTDSIEYALPLGFLGNALGSKVMEGKLSRVFAYRHRTTKEDLKSHARFSHVPRQTVLVSGASGLVGSSLVPYLSTAGHQVKRLVRSSAPRNPDEISWDPNVRVAFNSLTGIDSVVHLAGEGIADGRWSRAKKARIRDSRIRGTTTLCEGLLSLTPRPKTLICASAVGIYGSRGDEVLTEESQRGTGFLADVASEWEEATEIARAAGIRVVNLRIGVVLSAAGGALQKMLTPFRFGLGGRLGDGAQWMSWIALDDVLGLIEHALFTDTLHGPLNAVAPEPVTNQHFTHELAQVLGRPALLPIPKFVARAAFGELADEALLSSIKVSPAKALNTNYSFRFPKLRDALAHSLGQAGTF